MDSLDVNVSELIDNTRLNAFHIRVVGLCACLLFFEGFDLNAVSYAAPALAKALAISRPMLGPVFSAGQMGLMLGALIFGIAGDRWGRKRVFILCGLDFGLATLATALSTSYSTVVFWRLAAGLGLGGAAPIAITIASDYCPKRVRAALTMIMYCGYTIGGVFAGVVNAYFLRFGWRSVFYVGGAVPLLLAPVLILALPESLNYLISQGTRGAEIARILAQLVPGSHHSADSRFLMEQAYEKKLQVPELFRKGYARRTILLWMSLFVSLITLFSLTNWLPTLLNSMSITPKQVVSITAAAQGAGLVGSLVAARLIMTFRPFRVATIGYACAATLLVVLGMFGSGYAAFIMIYSVLYFFVIGDQNILNAMSGQIYPPRIRATGSGWAIGIGRVGGILGPTIAGALLALHWTPNQLFVIAGLPTLATAAIVFMLSNAMKGTLEIGTASPNSATEPVPE
jgi:AAHS family 4-hydroxybenzoate transporter-like MFS transporter